MLDAFRADPCRWMEALVDPRSLRRFWRALRRRGLGAMLSELTSEPESGVVTPASPQLADPSGLGAGAGPAVLVIDIGIPRYDRDAGGKSSYLYLRLLREMGCKVYFMPSDQMRREPYASLLESMGVELLIGPAYRCGRWVRWLDAQGAQVQCVILHRPNVAKRYLPQLTSQGVKKLIYFAHDLRSLRERGQFDLTRDSFHQSEAAYWDGVERSIIASVKVAYFFSHDEVCAVANWRGGECATMLPLYPESGCIPSSSGYMQREGLLFVGGFAHQPNLDAVLWFIREVLPLVRRELPHVRLYLVGAEPPAAVRDLSCPQVVLDGRISEDELLQRYETTRLVVAPLRFGAGMKGKVVEAMQRGVPVVTTPIGAQGIPEGASCLAIGESPDRLAAHICTLYQSGPLWKLQRNRALQVADKHFSRQAAVKRLQTDLEMDPEALAKG